LLYRILFRQGRTVFWELREKGMRYATALWVIDPTQHKGLGILRYAQDDGRNRQKQSVCGVRKKGNGKLF
jgi:hypothetical protein